MRVTIDTAPSIEPVTLADVKDHLRIDTGDSGDLADNITAELSVVAGKYTTDQTGAGVSVEGKRSLVNVAFGLMRDHVVVFKIDESDDGPVGEGYDDYTTWYTSGQLTSPDDDEQIYEIEYTGEKDYIRVVFDENNGLQGYDATGTVITSDPTIGDDDYLTRLITVAREEVESYTRRALISQTWLMYLDDWPGGRSIELPFRNLQSVTHVKYTDSAGDQSTWSSDDYDVDTDSTVGRILPGYGKSYPSVTRTPSNPIEIKFICGYGDARSNLPEGLRQAVLVIMSDYYENRETTYVGPYTYKENKLASRLMDRYTIHTFSRLGKDGFVEGGPC